MTSAVFGIGAAVALARLCVFFFFIFLNLFFVFYSFRLNARRVAEADFGNNIK